MPAKQKKLQHMVEFHEEYQCVFGEKASIHTIMKNRITHMNPPMPDSVCKEEMQNATIENDVIIEYITDAQGRKIKKLKPLLIKSEPDREYTQHMPIRKALTIDGENKAVNHLLHGEYEMTNTSWSKLQKKYSLSKNKIYSALKGKRRPRGSQYWQKRKQTRKLETTTSYTSLETK